ncbi:MAG: hypothetical protein LUC47_04840 [Clostridiales bacterium]|nr:hypothetical protein [Clostridiales bacterium]
MPSPQCWPPSWTPPTRRQPSPPPKWKKLRLRKGKTYYIRMRAYKTAGSVTSYAGWSKVKTVKVKK